MDVLAGPVWPWPKPFPFIKVHIFGLWPRPHRVVTTTHKLQNPWELPAWMVSSGRPSFRAWNHELTGASPRPHTALLVNHLGFCGAPGDPWHQRRRTARPGRRLHGRHGGEVKSQDRTLTVTTPTPGEAPCRVLSEVTWPPPGATPLSPYAAVASVSTAEDSLP